MLIGILQTGHAPEALRGSLGDYDDMFARLLAGQGFSFRAWDVEGQQIPSDPSAAQGWLITGSRHGAYEDHPWIPPLEEFIRAAAQARVPMVGVCFGHQIIAQAMGGRVEKSTKGWGAGRTVYDWAGQGAVALNAWHQDQVVTPPEGAEVFASTEHCALAGLVYGSQFWTVQPHPEFDDAMMEGLLEHRAKTVPEDRKAAARDGIGAPLDAAFVAAEIARFFKHPRP